MVSWMGCEDFCCLMTDIWVTLSLGLGERMPFVASGWGTFIFHLLRNQRTFAGTVNFLLAFLACVWVKKSWEEHL